MRYPWKRYAYPVDKPPGLSDEGFLLDQDRPLFKVANPQLVSLQDPELDKIPCVILLGEPGAGKTDAFETCFRESAARIESQGGLAISRRLGSYDTTDAINNDIFETQVFHRWKNGNQKLGLFLDSLDECHISIKNVAAFLEDRLRNCPKERLLFRIACRSTDWPLSLQETLSELYPNDEMKCLVIAPLQRKDVELAAKAEGISDPKGFARLVIEKDAVPWALKPLTLRFLIRTFQKSCSLPKTSSELFEEGCLLLCSEENNYRKQIGTPDAIGRMAPANRLALASRLAALCMLSNKESIWVGSQHLTPETHISLRDATGGDEYVG